jgi:hypothetical protein
MTEMDEKNALHEQEMNENKAFIQQQELQNNYLQ